jgi:hypothetical protein
VRCGGGFGGAPDGELETDPGGVDPERGPIAAPGFAMLGKSCVPGAFFAIGGGGLVPVFDCGTFGPVGDELGPLGGMRSPAAFWNAPRCESALLTASGDTGGTGAVPSCGGGAPDGGFEVVAGGGP